MRTTSGSQAPLQGQPERRQPRFESRKGPSDPAALAQSRPSGTARSARTGPGSTKAAAASLRRPRPFPTGPAGPKAAMLWWRGLREVCASLRGGGSGARGRGGCGRSGARPGRAEAAAAPGPRTRGKRAALALRRPRPRPAPAPLPALPLATAAVSQRPGPSRAPHSCSLVACWCILLFAIKRGGFFFFCSVSAAINSWSLKHLPFHFWFFFSCLFFSFFFFFAGRSEQFFAASIYFSISYLY